MATTSVRPPTRTGVERLTLVPSPSWPIPFHPQVQTVPSCFRGDAVEVPGGDTDHVGQRDGPGDAAGAVGPLPNRARAKENTGSPLSDRSACVKATTTLPSSCTAARIGEATTGLKL